MNTRHLVDRELLPVLEVMPARVLDAATLPQIRADAEARFAFLGTPALEPQLRTIAGPEGPLELYCYDPAPQANNRPALLHVHGGGMVLGSARSMQHGPAGIAAAAGMPVVSVNYRLAPEHPFPAPQQDCLAALTWLGTNAAQLGIDPGRIGIIGESAGGGLAAATALMARDTGGPALAAQFLTYPMLDHRTGGADCPYRNASTGEFVWTRAANQFGWAALQGSYSPVDHRRGWFSPSRAETLTRLPPTWIGTGSLDLFMDENLDYARRLTDAGVPVELHVYPGAIHAFNLMPDAALTKAFSRDLLGAISRWLQAPPPPPPQ